jgi:lysine 2,3-aminomutase
MKNTLYKASRHWKEIELWKDVTDEQWNDWVWQLTNTIKTLEDLKQVINLTPQEEEGVKIATKTIPLNITPYYAWLMDENDPKCPIRMQSVPISEELHKTRYDLEDPLHEDEDSPVPGLTRPRAVFSYKSMFYVLPLLYKKTFFRTNRNGRSQKTA